MSCIFCNDPRAAGEVLREDDRTLVILHDDWAVRGHAMVVWKKHVENVSDLTAGEAAHFMTAYHRAERALRAAARALRPGAAARRGGAGRGGAGAGGPSSCPPPPRRTRPPPSPPSRRRSTA